MQAEMNKVTMMLLFGSGLLLGFSNFFHRDELTPIYIGALILAIVPVFVLHYTLSRRKVHEVRAKELLEQAQNMATVRREVKSKIPKAPPRSDSQAAFEGSTKLGAVRSMAALVRKPILREKIMEICDFGDLVLETIRRMPCDTPAAVTFSEMHLARLSEALERFFEMYREGRQGTSPATEAHEVECFSAFITAFRKQQDYILLEGKTGKG